MNPKVNNVFLGNYINIPNTNTKSINPVIVIPFSHQFVFWESKYRLAIFLRKAEIL